MADQLDAEKVSDYLNNHLGFLEEHVIKHVDAETLERWLIRRSQRDRSQSLKDNPEPGRRFSLSRWKFCVHADKRKMLQTLMNSLASQPQGHILWELTCCVASAVGADGFVLHVCHLPDHRRSIYKSSDSDAYVDNDETFKFKPKDSSSCNDTSASVASYVAKYKDTLIIDDIRKPDPRFPDASPCLQEGGVHVLCTPIIQSDGNLMAIIELYRKEDKGDASNESQFHEEDEEIVSSYLVWGGIALHYADMYHALNKQRNLHQFLLTVVKSIFQDIVSMDSLISKVMSFAQKLVDADRASLFLVDHKSSEVYARIFDMGGGMSTTSSQEIRFPIGTGIAGQVALTGKALNIADAYSDPRFNRAVDQRIGYQTRSILCMPIFIEGRVFSVVQMVNKRHGSFTKEDEESFESFATYCGLALHQAKLYDRIRLSEQIYRVTLEVLSYHSCCTEEEVSALQSLPDAGDTSVGIDQFWFNSFSLDDLAKVNSAVFMFVDLFGLVRFERDSLIRFMLTVKKNYRRVPYHNWTHGFNVANCMYAILKRADGAFEPLEALSLFVGALCHDLDHRGKNNQFMMDSASPLASIYTTSTMEHHHFNQTVTILQQDSQNIFSKLPSEEYKQVLRNIKHCILATDLANFIPNREKLAQLVEKDQFSWQEKEHRLLLEAVAMTGSDLSISAKPWDIQAETVKVTFEEFYQQGDAERQAGRIPIAMMDRSKPHLLPASQVGFITSICIPCYSLLNRLIPETQPLLDGCQTNLQRWKELAADNEASV